MEKYNISGMSCAACSARVERAVSSLDGVTACSVNLLTNSMTVEGSDSKTVIAAVEAAGYGAALADSSLKPSGGRGEDIGDKREVKALALRLVSSLAILLILMYVSMGHIMWNFPLPSRLSSSPAALGLLQLLLALAVMIINQKFFISGTRAILKRSPNMDSLVALGSFSAFLWSTVVLFRICLSNNIEYAYHYLHDMYFESAAMIVALITLGKMLEAIAKGKTTSAIQSLLALTPPEAHIIRNGVEITVQTKDVLVGDVFIVRPGESFPVDGEIIKGESTVNEASLTGESMPLDKRVGDRVFAASQNLSGYIECRATKVGEDTLMGEVVKIVSDAASSKAPISKLADRVSGIFVPAVLVTALITTVIWIFINRDVGFALARGISVLVISCPCALGLATPVAIMVGSGIGAKGGVLFKSAAAIEATGRARIIALDKTGTITLGKPVVTDVLPYGISEDELIKTAASLEKKSEHPLARAILSLAEERDISVFETNAFEALSGNGVRAYCDSVEILGGSFSFISAHTSLTDNEREEFERLSSEGKTPLFFTKGGNLVGIIAVADEPKPDSIEAIAKMKKMGLRCVMLTGDNEITAKAIATRVGIDEVFASVMPRDKSDIVARLSRDGKCIMVGDGINDAPALTSADVGIAMGRGTDIAIESADAVLMGEGLSSLVGAVKLGRETLKNIKENLFWAFIYNVIGIPIAAGVFIHAGLTLTPMLGAAAMSISSVTVVMNALRLNTKRFFEKTDNASNPILKKAETVMINLKVKGMMCPHCEARVKSTLLSVNGVKSADVSHKAGTAEVEADVSVSAQMLIDAVVSAGYECTAV